MIRNLLVILFVATIGSRALGLDLGLGPGLSIKNALLYSIATLIAVDGAIARNRKVELLSVVLPFALLIFYAAMSWIFMVVFVDDPLYSKLQTLIRLKVKLVDQFIIFLVFFYGVVNLKDVLWMLKAVIWVVVGGCLITIVDTFNVPDLGIITVRPTDGRVEGIIGSAAEFGGLLAFFIPPIVALWWVERGLRKALALLGVGLALVCIMISASRGAMLGLLTGTLAGAFYLRRHIAARIFTRATIAVLAFVGIAVMLVMVSDFGFLLEERLYKGFETGDVATISSGRTAIWSAAFREMMDSPLSFVTGLGWESYFQTIGYRYATHNVFLDRLYNLGIIGLTLFTLSYVSAVFFARRALTHVADPAQPFVMAMIIGMISFMLAMVFTDLEGAANYAWAYSGLALRAALIGMAAAPQGRHDYFPERLWNRDQAKLATRPMSTTPMR